MKTLTLLAALGLTGTALAADHGEAPAAFADPPADIADFYAWHTANGTIVAVITVQPLAASGDDAMYDADVLYGVHIDTDLDTSPDTDIWVRFGQDSEGNWGVQAEGLPGASGTVSGAVETVLEDGNTKVWAGMRDDPFFFDAEGYGNTLSTGSVAFTGADFFAGLNALAIVLEFDTAATVGAEHQIQTWATTGRK